MHIVSRVSAASPKLAKFLGRDTKVQRLESSVFFTKKKQVVCIILVSFQKHLLGAPPKALSEIVTSCSIPFRSITPPPSLFLSNMYASGTMVFCIRHQNRTRCSSPKDKAPEYSYRYPGGCGSIQAPSSGTATIRSCIPRRVGIEVAAILGGILHLAHRGTATTDSAAEIGAGAAASHEVEGESGDKGDPAEPQEGAGGLCLAAVLARVARAVCDLVGSCVCRVGAAVCAQVSGESDGGAETEEYAQGVHGDVDNGDAELVDEGGGQEVEEGEEPPHAHEERVVDNGVDARVGARNVVAHEGCNEDGAE